MTSRPPLPESVLKTCLQSLPSSETWIDAGQLGDPLITAGLGWEGGAKLHGSGLETGNLARLGLLQHRLLAADRTQAHGSLPISLQVVDDHHRDLAGLARSQLVGSEVDHQADRGKRVAHVGLK